VRFQPLVDIRFDTDISRGHPCNVYGLGYRSRLSLVHPISK
jgi:hypothetical protein